MHVPLLFFKFLSNFQNIYLKLPLLAFLFLIFTKVETYSHLHNYVLENTKDEDYLCRNRKRLKKWMGRSKNYSGTERERERWAEIRGRKKLLYNYIKSKSFSISCNVCFFNILNLANFNNCDRWNKTQRE